MVRKVFAGLASRRLSRPLESARGGCGSACHRPVSCAPSVGRCWRCCAPLGGSTSLTQTRLLSLRETGTKPRGSCRLNEPGGRRRTPPDPTPRASSATGGSRRANAQTTPDPRLRRRQPRHRAARSPASVYKGHHLLLGTAQSASTIIGFNRIPHAMDPQTHLD